VVPDGHGDHIRYSFGMATQTADARSETDTAHARSETDGAVRG
jgi:hypothetical protein